jgi:hypothetical protein
MAVWPALSTQIPKKLLRVYAQVPFTSHAFVTGGAWAHSPGTAPEKLFVGFEGATRSYLGLRAALRGFSGMPGEGMELPLVQG